MVFQIIPKIFTLIHYKIPLLGLKFILWDEKKISQGESIWAKGSDEKSPFWEGLWLLQITWDGFWSICCQWSSRAFSLRKEKIFLLAVLYSHEIPNWWEVDCFLGSFYSILVSRFLKSIFQSLNFVKDNHFGLRTFNVSI